MNFPFLQLHLVNVREIGKVSILLGNHDVSQSTLEKCRPALETAVFFGEGLAVDRKNHFRRFGKLRGKSRELGSVVN